MALQQNYYHQQLGILLFNAYWRINPKTGLVGGKDEMNYIIEVFKDAGASHVEHAQPIDRLTLMFVPDINSANNFIAQAYSHAKSTQYFNGSVDV